MVGGAVIKKEFHMKLHEVLEEFEALPNVEAIKYVLVLKSKNVEKNVTVFEDGKRWRERMWR